MIRLRDPHPIGMLRRLRDDERGAALATVLGVSIVLLILIAIGASYSISGMRKTATDADGSGALAAAYAGADEYTSRLSNDARYSRFGNPASPFTIATGSAGKVTLPTGTDSNPAFQVNSGGSWGAVDGSGGRASYRYEIDNADYDRTGVIRVRSTGKVGNETRSIIVSIKQRGFIDYLYFTDLETIDPDIRPACNLIYDYIQSHSNDCRIRFIPSDTLHGPVHSNDTISMCGRPTFEGAVSTGDPRNSNWYDDTSCTGNPDFQAGDPVSVAPLPMPPTNTALANEARADMPDTVPRPGCMYTGPTRIVFNANQTVTIKSPLTIWTQPGATAGASRNPTGCGTPGTGPGGLASNGGATVSTLGSPLDHNLIWVQGVPTNTSDPNYRATPTSTSTGLPGTFKCLAAYTGQNQGTGNNRPATNDQPDGWSFGSGTSLIRYPLANERKPTTSSSTATPYGCANGDVYVEGTMTGAITIAAANFVYVTDSIRYGNSEVDMLGLIGQNSVWVWDPYTCDVETRDGVQRPGRDNCSVRTGSANRQIDAAILSVAHTFMVQNYDVDLRGTLTVRGSIAQKFRGTVSTFSGNTRSNGYAKNYNYDERFKTIAPPSS
ncbi:hypothetical protein [Agromyces protaetiae]|uniref:hypothetical protein n=1 Tax=Agromyces protaetiae TaxID=2509455 RepID=UPI001FB5D5EB|nr:hypothetical protein [Agromyces protaetiae]